MLTRRAFCLYDGGTFADVLLRKGPFGDQMLFWDWCDKSVYWIDIGRKVVIRRDGFPLVSRKRSLNTGSVTWTADSWSLRVAPSGSKRHYLRPDGRHVMSASRTMLYYKTFIVYNRRWENNIPLLLGIAIADCVLEGGERR